MSNAVIVEGADSIHVVTSAFLAQEDREVAWAGARQFMDIRPDIGWVMGNFVQSDVANLNGHIFPLSDLQDNYKGIVNTPLNMLHRSRHTVGAYVAAEMIYPTEGDIETPFVEALASFWRSIYTDEWAATQAAHDDGALAFSMECIPASLTCATCQTEVQYAGLQSDTYCAHLNRPGSPKQLNKPHFVGGAIVIPPARPGWSRADVKELASFIESRTEEADGLIDAFKSIAPHLEPKNWEGMMTSVMAGELGKASFDLPEITLPTLREARKLRDETRLVAFVAPVPLSTVSDAIGGTPDVLDSHVTLLYAGKEGEISLTREAASRILDVLAEAFQPFDVAIDSAGRFENDDETATWLKADAQELHDINQALTDALEGLVKPSDHPSYTPHITISYDPARELPDVEATSFRVESVELWWGDDVTRKQLGEN